MNDLLRSLATTATAVEIGILFLSLAVSYVLVRFSRPEQIEAKNIWFGDRTLDGILFPATALLIALLITAALDQWLWQQPRELHFALPVLLSLTIIRISARVLQSAFPESTSVRLAERTLSWVVWGATVLWILGVLPVALAAMEKLQWHLGGSDVSLRDMLEGGISVLLVMLAALWISSAIEHRLLTGASENLSIRKIAANAIRAVLLLIGLLIALSAAGIPIGALGVLSGAVGVGIGFGLQRLASNYVSGFVILAERSVRIGDMVKVDNFEGRITDIKTRYTIVRALNGRESIVPNELLITSRVENSSFADPHVLVQTTVTVAYGTDVEALIPQLIDSMALVPRVLEEPEPSVQLSNFAADGLELTLMFWIADPQNGQGNVKSDVNRQVLKLLNEQQIEIPYPQRVIRQPNSRS